MRAFISHAFGGGDDQLAGTLKGDLEGAGVGGYLAEAAQRYDLLISDKIRQEIEESEWLVAIITRGGQASASVHEEIGYALGKGVEVALMVEEGAREGGVLAHGREPETFRRPDFGIHSRRVARFIAGSPRPAPRPPPLGEAAKGLLESRNMMSAESASFAQNRHLAGLHDGGFYGGAEKPAILFSSCPHDLRDRGSVTAPEFRQWARFGPPVMVEGRKVILGGPDERIDMKTLILARKHPHAPSGRDVSTYLEFQDNGFLEYGTSSLFLGWEHGNNELNLCHMVGNFWGFLACARLFYQRIHMDSPFTVLLSVRNSSKLVLGNYGNEVLADPNQRHSLRLPLGRDDPRTDRANIQVPHAFAGAGRMTDADIAGIAREAADTVCNAYGQDGAKCYDEDGRFAWDLWGEITS